MSYMDTSVIVASLDKLNSRQRVAQEVLERGRLCQNLF